MVWSIPNTFVDGTKARANEVNENFTSLKQFVDSLEVQTSTNEIDIMNLENTKANLNGDNQQRFQVADASNDYDAINKQLLFKYTQNSQGVINGFKLSKSSNDTIIATAGSCYDSTFKYMIISDTSLTKQQSGLGNDAKYYIYVCADKETEQCQLVITLNSSTPELPADYDYYRKLGYLITNDEGNISQVINEGEETTGTYENQGYITLSGGLTIQWGYADVNLNNSAVDINLPTVYKMSHLCCVCSPNNSWSNGDWDRICVGCQPISLSQIRIIGGRSAAYRVYYISIGI